MKDHVRAANMATRAIIDLIDCAEALQTAIISKAEPDEVEALTQKARAIYESYIEHTVEAAVLVRDFAEP